MGVFLDRCWVIVAIFSPFFWETNVMDTQSAVRSCVNVSVCLISVDVPSPKPLKNRTCSIVMIFVFLRPSAVLVLEYSHDRMAKKRAPVVSVDSASRRGFSVVMMKRRQKASGRHAWLFLGGSLSLYALSCLVRSVHFTPEASLVGSG